MDATKRYELIRPILLKEKTVEKVHSESGISSRTLRRYLSRFQASGSQIESLIDKPPVSHCHPNWLAEEQKDRVVAYKQNHPDKSSRQIANELSESGVLNISYRSVVNILSERQTSPPFCPIDRRN
jgi:predicted DNA-binding transcriptional regulator YafY